MRDGSHPAESRLSPSLAAVAGVGLGLRWVFIDQLGEATLPRALRFFEFSPENYMRRGGHYVAALERVATLRPLLSHGLMGNLGGHDPLDPDYLSQLRALLDRFELAEHSDHLCWTAQGGRCLHELLPLGWSAEGLERCVGRLGQMQTTLGRRMSVENVSAYAQVARGEHEPPADAAMREAAFICQLLGRCDAGLLLDVNNAWVNAQNHGFDAWSFIEALPLERVTQIHVAGGEQRSDMHKLWIDTHGTAVPAPVVELMQRVVERIGPVPVLYERDHNIPPLSELLAEVQELDVAYQAALCKYAPADAERQAARPSIELRVGGPELDTHTRLAELCLATAEPHDDLAVPGLPAPAPAVYRQLVRGTLSAPLREFFEPCAQRLGPRFDELVSEFLAAGASASPYLRDLGGDFVAFVQTRLDAAPPYMAELFAHSWVAYQVGAAPPHPPAQASALPFELEGGVLFDAAVQLRSGDYALHELEAGQTPTPRPTHLLAYRDATHTVRFLELSEFARSLVAPLLGAPPSPGPQSLEHSLRQACGVRTGAIGEADLQRSLAVLGELGERGIVLGGRDLQSTR